MVYIVAFIVFLIEELYSWCGFLVISSEDLLLPVEYQLVYIVLYWEMAISPLSINVPVGELKPGKRASGAIVLMVIILICPPSTNNLSSLYFPFKLSRSGLHRFILPVLGVWKIPKGDCSELRPPFPPSFVLQGCCTSPVLLSWPLQPWLLLPVSDYPRWWIIRNSPFTSFLMALDCLSHLDEAILSFPSQPHPSDPPPNTSGVFRLARDCSLCVFIFCHWFLKSTFRSGFYSFSRVNFLEAASGQCSFCHLDSMRECVIEWKGAPQKGEHLRHRWCVWRRVMLQVHTKGCFFQHLIFKV